METLIVQKVTELPVSNGKGCKGKSKYASLLKNVMKELAVGEHYKLVLQEGPKQLGVVRTGLKLHATQMGFKDSIKLTAINGVLYVTKIK